MPIANPASTADAPFLARPSRSSVERWSIVENRSGRTVQGSSGGTSAHGRGRFRSCHVIDLESRPRPVRGPTHRLREDGGHPRVPIEEPLAAMARLRDDGLVDHLGVSNFTGSQLEMALDAADAPIVTNQVMYHPYQDQSNLRSFCRDHDVALTAYSPLARGAVLDDEVLGAIGERYDRTAAQVALRWLIEQDGVVAVPKATGRQHVGANIDVFDFSLTAQERARIDDLTSGLRQRLRNALLPLQMRWVPF